MQWVLPIPDYYDGSVTLGLAPFRPSRVLLLPYCRVVLGGLFVPCEGSFPPAPTSELRVPGCYGSAAPFGPLAKSALSLDALAMGLACAGSELGFKQCSFHHTTQVLRGGNFSVFSLSLAFPPCSCPLCLSASGKSVHLKVPPSNFAQLRWEFSVRVPRRTLSAYPALRAGSVKRSNSFPLSVVGKSTFTRRYLLSK